jgi:predicted deacylase
MLPGFRRVPHLAAGLFNRLQIRTMSPLHSSEVAMRKSRIVLPSMTPGTGRHLTVYRFGKAGARPKAYLQASIHANELPGAMALHHLLPMLVEAERRGRIQGEVVVVPVVNPIGLSQLVGNNHLGRYDFLGRDNFNRNWHDLSEAVAKRVDGKLGRWAR